MIQQRSCRTCGRSFEGGPRAYYCPECLTERRRESWRNYKRRKNDSGPRRLIDLAGQRFGRLTVVKEIKKAPGSKERRWLCRCDCGNVTVVRMVSLRTGNTRSCGCLLGETSARKLVIDMTGQKIHHLTVLGRAGSYSKKGYSIALWLCECDCGNVITISGTSLRSGNSKSCGCMRKGSKA